MNRCSSLVFVSLLLSTVQAKGQDFAWAEFFEFSLTMPTVASAWSTSVITGEGPGIRYRAARDDAAAFLASGGSIHGAQLERVLRDLGAVDAAQQTEVAFAIVSLP